MSTFSDKKFHTTSHAEVAILSVLESPSSGITPNSQIQAVVIRPQNVTSLDIW